ncbi:MAG: P-loop NTPase [Methanomassiliicoccales archaeon]
MALKVAVSGKGGVGKTTLTGLLARLFGREGDSVLVLDADPASNLASAVGVSRETSSHLTPLSSMLDMIEERTGVKPGESYGGMFKLNPKVDDLADRFAVEGKDNVRLLVLGTIRSGGSGCFCPESSLLKSLLKHLVLEKDEFLFMDMEAGLEHLGRASSRNMDLMIVVVEPGMRSLETAAKIRDMAAEIGIDRVGAVLNKASPGDQEVVSEELDRLGMELLATIPYNRKLVEADLKGVSPMDIDGADDVIEAIAGIKERIVE